MIKVCEKCMRIKLNEDAPWSPRPSPQVTSMPKSKFETVEECDYCDGTIQAPPGKKEPEPSSEESGEDVRPSQGHREHVAVFSSDGEPNSKVRKQRGRPPGKKKVKIEEGDSAGKNEDSDINERNDPKCSAGNGGQKEDADQTSEEDSEGTRKPQENEAEIVTDDKLATIANQHHQALVQCKKLMGQSMLEFCKHLREIKNRELFRFYASSWYEYLSMPEIGLDDTRARRLIRLINVKDAMEKQLGREVNFDEISEARLTRDLLPCIQYDEGSGQIKNIKVAEELLDNARSLGHEDWQAEVEKKKPRVAGRKAAEVLIAAPAPVMDEKNNIIGQLISVSANDENHYLKIRVETSSIPEGDFIIKIK